MFQAIPDQVRAVRDFVRLALIDHPAVQEAVAVASELATNTVVHSGSGHTEGMFTVHISPIGRTAAWLVITELRGAGFPSARSTDLDAASGRGLAIVQELTSQFWVSDGAEIRILLATIPAPPSDPEP